MLLTVNGEIHEVEGPISVLGLIERFGFEAHKVAIERNLEIVPRSTYGATFLSEGDRLEIVHFVGGG
ncbi:MAG TPA: sulfur carrier protein ThiS [Parvibaculum sp.]|uniref:sulfur carrier protein ThiS n=1 Tax=Parvibaculum sp. TaxID=2024848 RepID=UPI002C9EA18D|nr:sulfur carrier protein ThiS [Parvibaculum sp.]HMM14663.1 sulfur carrier protein ThiS [Parvibaculum sp.]